MEAAEHPQSGRHAEIAVNRWTRYGKDRLYGNLPDGTRVGYLDLQTEPLVLERDDLRTEFQAALAEWRAESDGSVPAALSESDPPELPPEAPDQRLDDQEPAPPTDHESFAITIDWRDLATHEAGKAAAEQARAERQAAPVRTLAARLLGVHTDERAWRVGAQGERLVAAQFAKLPEDWKVLHALPVGERGADIDHFVAGPGGVFTINTKHHPNANVWIGGNTVMVNGQRQPYVRNSRHEAARAARLLSAAVGWPVPVVGVIVFVGARKGFTIKAQPDDVHVVGRKHLRKWLLRRAASLTPGQVEDVYRAARRSDTWG